MKILISIFTFLTMASFFVTAQNVPLGMKYQAVARDLSGQILADKTINLQINLIAVGEEKTLAYSENHVIKTNMLGLFTLSIGEGTVKTGGFAEVPWSSKEVWMEVKIQENEGEDFITISNSQMLSVPYAFHAATANDITGVSAIRESGSLGVPSQNWSLFGNSTSDPLVDKLGTTDLADLVIVTNNIERMRILEGGDIEMVNNVNIGKDLTVEESVYLNATTGKTVNYGPFKVDNMSPTSLTGSLTVFNKQPTLLSGTLTVDLATDLNTSLNVDGITDLNSSLNVNNGSPTLLTGTLEVDNDATFHNHVLLDNAALSSTSTTTGALVVAGGLGLGENLNVGGSAAFGGPVNFMSPVTISADEESTSSTTGALRVVGGVGIGKRLNVIGATSLGNTLGVTGATTLSNTLGVTGATNLISSLTVGGATQLNSTLGVTGITRITNNTASTNVSSGALVVTGGAGLGGNLNVGGSTTLNGTLNLSANVANAGSGANPVTTPGNHIVNFYNANTNGNGISIKLNVGTPQNKNNFITFYNSAGSTVGRIEGENGQADYDRNAEYTNDVIFKSIGLATTTLDAALTTAEEILAGTEIVAAATSSTACVGLGACVTTPIPSIIVWTTAQFIVRTAQLVLRVADVAIVAADLGNFIQTHKDLRGITFASGSEDYAEYLYKQDLKETFMPGDIVGVKNGYISKNTKGADKIMVISLKPIVAGGLPQDEDVSNYELVAFMGQVPTKVFGKVKAGDYILPSGYQNGSGIAKSPRLMQPEDYKKILGVAWEANIGGGLGYVNVAIGLNTNDLADLVKQQADQIEDLKTQMRRNNIILADLVPGYAEALKLDPRNVVEGDSNEHHEHNHESPESQVQEQFVDEMMGHAEGDIVYFNIERKHLEEGLKMAEDIMLEAYERNGLNLDDHPFWQRMKAEPNYKEEIFANVNEELKHAMHTHKLVDQKMTEQK
jgi:hypothetical protein